MSVLKSYHCGCYQTGAGDVSACKTVSDYTIGYYEMIVDSTLIANRNAKPSTYLRRALDNRVNMLISFVPFQSKFNHPSMMQEEEKNDQP